MGLDVGNRTIGIAISDPLKIFAQGLTTIRRTNEKEDILQIIDMIDEYNIDKIIIGLPINMNDTLGPQGEKVKDFGEKLEKSLKDIDIIYQDERLTTISAEKMLIDQNVRRKNRKKVIDKIAATYILQSYLDSLVN